MDIYGVIGYPIKHSLSPLMHNAAFKKMGIEAEYKLFEVMPEELEDFLLNKKEVVGFNITIPHKVKAKEIFEKRHIETSEESQHYVSLCGAINTVKREDEKIEYTNTDVVGFLTSLRKDLKFDPTNKNMIVFGCGGAGRSIIAGLGTLPSKVIYIYDNNINAIAIAKDFFSRSSSLKDRLKFITKDEISKAIKDSQLLVNATPLGMKEGGATLVDKGLLHEELSIYDVVYNRKTELLKDAESKGLSAAGGIGMFLYQGAHAFEFWTGEKAPIQVMKKALEEAIKSK